MKKYRIYFTNKVKDILLGETDSLNEAKKILKHNKVFLIKAACGAINLYELERGKYVVCNNI